MAAQAVIEIDANRIAMNGLRDRLEEDDGDHAALKQSIQEHGQQVPVLVRPDPRAPDRYRIVYGRRRVRALRELGLPVKALLRHLGDCDTLIAQGQENSARKNLSFIEKAAFAGQMHDMGYGRTVICAALHVDKTVMSRMISLMKRLQPELIREIGAAPSVGRDRWIALADLMQAQQKSASDALFMLRSAPPADGSDRRFETLFALLSKPAGPRPKRPRRMVLHDAGGARLGHYRTSAEATVLTLPTGA